MRVIKILKSISLLMACLITTQPIKAQGNTLITMPDIYVCTGSSTTLDAGSGTCGANYLWNSGATTQQLTVNQAGTYTSLVTYPDGTSCQKTFVVKYYNSSLINIVSSTSSYCIGSNITLTTSGGCNYIWSSSDYSIANPNGSSIVVTPQSTGVYAFNVTGTNFYGCQENKTISLTINPSPNISLVSPQEICPNTSIILDAGAGTNYSYNWSNNLGNLQTAIVNSTGTYIVTVTNSDGCSANASTIVNNSPFCTTIVCNSTTTYTYLPIAITCYQVSGATQYQFKYEQLDASNNIVRTSFTPPSTGNGAAISSAVPAICYNAHYLVSARVFKNGVWGPYGTPCNINVGHPRNISGHGYCGVEYSNLNGQMCTGLPTSFATKFRWKFVEVNGSNIGNPGILENTASCAAISNTLPHLLYNKVYKVSFSTYVPYWDAVGDSVKHEWSPYGPECTDSIHDPRNGPNNGYCGIHYTTLTNQIFSTEYIALAQKYRITFTRLDVTEPAPHVAISPNAISTNIPLSLLDIPLTLNASYSVTISSFVPYDLDANGNYTNYMWSPEGKPCKITTGNVYARYGNTNETKHSDGISSSHSKIVISPNPTNDIINITSELEVNKIELFNYNGSLVKTLNSNKEGVNLSDVPKGVYIVVITTKEGLYRERIIKE